MWLKKLALSFRWAGEGLWLAVRTQRNLRVHLAALCYVTWAGLAANLDRLSWGLIILCCALVLALELINSGLEALCNRVCSQSDPHIKAAKDCAAAGVLLAAIASVVLACLLFGPWVASGGLAKYCTPTHLVVFLFSLPVAMLWIRGRRNRKP